MQKWSLGKLIYHIRANRTPLLNKTPGDTFWAHYGHFRQKIGEKLVFSDENLPKLTLVGGLKTQQFNRTPAFYWRGYDRYFYLKFLFLN
jgi:hypothetical protein